RANLHSAVARRRVRRRPAPRPTPETATRGNRVAILDRISRDRRRPEPGRSIAAPTHDLDEGPRMNDIDTRTALHTFAAFAAYETVEAICRRIYPMLTNGRRIIYIERWLTGADDSDRVLPSQRILTRAEDREFGLTLTSNDEQVRFAIQLTSAIAGVTVTGRREFGTEDTAAELFRATHAAARRAPGGDYLTRRDVAMIQVVGRGHGDQDHITVTSYNAHGAGLRRSLYFETATQL
ncbi:hypothetical protein ACWIGI_41580, partial [Nocardia sp. NPDC055321]